MKKRNDAPDFFSKFLAGETDEKENEELYHWLMASPDRLQEFAQYKQIWDNLVLAHETDKMDEQVVYHKLKNKIQQTWRLKRKFIIYAGIAASLVLLLSSTFLLNKIRNNMLPYETNIITSRAQQKKIILPDQTIVWLNSESQLTYSGNFKNKYREVSLSGEAFFEVTKDSVQPFIVKTQNITIQVLGTRFNVNSYEENDRVETTVVEGHVAVIPRQKEASLKKIHLLKNDKATFAKNSKTFRVAKVDANAYRLWTQGQLCFKEQSLPEIIKILERHFNVEITLKDISLEDYVFTATFEKEKSIQDILDVFKLTSPMDYSLIRDQISIYLKK